MSSQGFLYLVGGQILNKGAQDTLYQIDLEKIVSSSNTSKFEVIQRSSMNYKKYDFCLVQMKNFLYVFGGKDENDNVVDTAERYNIFSDKW